jgi:hypothetical protein
MWEELEGKEQWDRKVVIDINLKKKFQGFNLPDRKEKIMLKYCIYKK